MLLGSGGVSANAEVANKPNAKTDKTALTFNAFILIYSNVKILMWPS
jgi:hypothetical protein